MAGPARSPNEGSPIRLFIDIPSTDRLDAFTALINDLNQNLALIALGLPAGATIDTVAHLTTKLANRAVGIATDGQGVGESGAGTGIPTYMKSGVLRTYSTDQPVTTGVSMPAMFDDAAFSELMPAVGLAQ